MLHTAAPLRWRLARWVHVLRYCCSSSLLKQVRLEVLQSNRGESPTQEPPPSPFWQLTRTMVWVLPGRKLGPWSEFLFSTDLQHFWILAVQILRGLSFGLSFLILWGWGWFPHRQGNDNDRGHPAKLPKGNCRMEQRGHVAQNAWQTVAFQGGSLDAQIASDFKFNPIEIAAIRIAACSVVMSIYTSSTDLSL